MVGILDFVFSKLRAESFKLLGIILALFFEGAIDKSHKVSAVTTDEVSGHGVKNKMDATFVTTFNESAQL